MPRTPLLTALFGLMISTGAAAAADGAHPTGAALLPAASPPPDPATVQASLRRSGTELAQLQRDVAAQERRSREAARRLRQQDRRLEQLRRQLQSVQAGAQAGAGVQNPGQ
ncbi:hypothetical protein ACO2Q2_13895 [Dyella sp. KRB-257]|uniref:hypothetical protein n=1 Tax=Dyella sp. KRB-257 TaxID=3400915 RepID=UPI003C0C9B92